jgi:hypothetical protein
MQEAMLGGLGNTFSDALGVLIGGACLAIAKAGLNVDPGFWIMDVFSMILGCLLGVFLPAILFNWSIVDVIWRWSSVVGLVSLVVAVCLTAFPHGDGLYGLIGSIVFLAISFLVFFALVCNMVFDRNYKFSKEEEKRAFCINIFIIIGFTVLIGMMVLVFILPFAFK